MKTNYTEYLKQAIDAIRHGENRAQFQANYPKDTRALASQAWAAALKRVPVKYTITSISEGTHATCVAKPRTITVGQFFGTAGQLVLNGEVLWESKTFPYGNINHALNAARNELLPEIENE